MNGFTIEVTSKYADWGRYNVNIIGELLDSTGQRTGYLSTDGKTDGRSSLNAGDAELLRLFVYVIPESMPANRVVGDAPEFQALLRVQYGGRTIGSESFDIDRWGGASLERIFNRTGIQHE